MNILHITNTETWNQALLKGIYEMDALSDLGFIHCCLPGQMAGVLARWFQDTSGLLALEIDPQKLKSRTVYENLEGGKELFPHIYGPINLDAVVAIHPIGE